MEVVLYSTHCPKCNVLTTKLNSKNVQYTEVTDINVMESKGIKSVPMLEVDSQMMDFKKAVDWIKDF